MTAIRPRQRVGASPDPSHPTRTEHPMTSTSETTYRVTGMTCGHCALSVQEEVEELPGVERASVDHAAGTLVVIGTADAAAVREAVSEAGYRLVD